MKPVFKCDYCSFMGTEEEVAKHEITCVNNYGRKSCYTCQHKSMPHMVNKLVKYDCNKGIDVPEGKICEFCGSYERKEQSENPLVNLFGGMFGGF